MVGLPRPDAGTYGTGRTFRHPEGGTVNLRTQATETPGLEPVTMAERRERLAWLIANEAKRGWHVESQMDYQATLAKGHRPNHLLHLILTVLTLGAWLLVWIPVSIFTSESRKVVTIDGYGRIV
jgi:hypothetical protein